MVPSPTGLCSVTLSCKHTNNNHEVLDYVLGSLPNGGKPSRFSASNFNKLSVPSLHSSNTCVPAHPSPPSRNACKQYTYGVKGECSKIIGKRLIYGSLSNQEKKEKENLLKTFKNIIITAKGGVRNKDNISDKCLQTVELVYCNHYFRRCDNTSSKILPVPVCREACEVMVQQRCEEEYRRAREIKKLFEGSEGFSFDLINCTTLPRRNGGTIPECYYPRELEGNCLADK